MVRRESRPNTISHITLGTKQTGAPSAGNLHAGCDVAGAGNGFTVWLLRHSQRKRGATARLDLRNTAPVLDPTGQHPATGLAPPLGRKTPKPLNWHHRRSRRGSGRIDALASIDSEFPTSYVVHALVI